MLCGRSDVKYIEGFAPFKFHCAALRANGGPQESSWREWSRSLGGPTSNRFSSLDQIRKENVAQLQPAWIYHSGDGGANIQCNPIIVDGVMYVPTAGRNVAAVNAVTGQEIWRFTPE